jgi:hypothetical protein
MPFSFKMLSIRSAVSSTLKLLWTLTIPSEAIAGKAMNTIANVMRIVFFIFPSFIQDPKVVATGHTICSTHHPPIISDALSIWNKRLQPLLLLLPPFLRLFFL